MSNMSYCRMYNTLGDLQDVHKYWDDANSEEELRSRQRILELCREIVDSHSDDYDYTLTEEEEDAENEAHENYTPSPVEIPAMPEGVNEDELKAEARKLRSEGSYLGAVKYVKEITGFGLREAKEYCDLLD